MKEVDLCEPTQHHSLTTSTWVVLNGNAKQAQMWWTITEICFESRISAGAKEKLPC